MLTITRIGSVASLSGPLWATLPEIREILALMKTSVAELFEGALRRRGVTFAYDQTSDRFEVHSNGSTLLVSLKNLERQYIADGDGEGIDRFAELVLSTPQAEFPQWETARGQVLHSFELNDYVEPSAFRISVTERVDRVPTLLDDSAGTLTWIEADMLSDWGVMIRDITEAANTNLAAAIQNSRLKFHELESGRLGYFETPLPFKAPLLFSPNLRLVVEAQIGWPIHAAIPDRDFLFIWSAQSAGIDRQIAATVIEEFDSAPHPLTTEVLEVSDTGIRAIGDLLELVA